MTRAAAPAQGGFRIAEVARRTGIPITTLRFYEKELPGLFPLRKTRGGHRRYRERDVQRFAAVRRLTREGVGLSDVRRVMMSRGENEALREDVDLLLGVQHAGTRAIDEVLRKLEALESRVALLESVPRRRSWLGRSPRE
ncbi:MAG: MerR family transcriptional regulator [Thermoanaerobaculia bacterium]